MVDHLVPPRELVLIPPPLEQRGPYPGRGPHRPVVADRRKNTFETLQQILDLVLLHVDRIEVAVEVVVGRTEQCEPGVGHHQQVTSVDRLGADREVRDAMRVDDVNAFGGSEVDLDAGHRADLGRPRAGCIDHHTGARL